MKRTASEGSAVIKLIDTAVVESGSGSDGETAMVAATRRATPWTVQGDTELFILFT